jgi:tRNA-(ms[2]io[6]A)-hydroxylase
MLKLKLNTDPVWVKNAVEGNIQAILTDHAFCEQKAASMAISILVIFPEHLDLVEKMADLAKEEMSHFQMVLKLIKDRGYVLGKERKDDYVHELKQFFKNEGRGREGLLSDKLLLAAMIEARSCERFMVISENINDKELADFYFQLMKSEARHYTMFLSLARELCPSIDVDSKWERFLAYEAEVISKRGVKEEVHG